MLLLLDLCMWLGGKWKITFFPGFSVKIKNTRTGVPHTVHSGILVIVLPYTRYCEVKIIVLGTVFLSFTNLEVLYNEKSQVGFPTLFDYAYYISVTYITM